jgi:hypothetical protein
MIFLVFINGNIWSAYEHEPAAQAAADELGGIVQPIHFVRGRK